MNLQQRGMIALLKSAVTGEKTQLPEGFCLEDAYAVARKHHIVNALYVGACSCGLPQTTQAMQEMFAFYCGQMMRSEAQLRELSRVLKAFDENGIDYLPLKGSRIKALYPKPELRYMGDADILIRIEQYGTIETVMQSLGFTFCKASDHELVWKSPALLLELHKRIVPSYNEDFYSYFGDGWCKAFPETGTRYAMRLEDEWIFLFTHFSKHFRDGGIGCRYVMDLWLFRRAHPQMDENYIRQELKKLWLDEFHDNILQLIEVWFEGKETDPKMDLITEVIFASGSWGTGTAKRLSAAVKDTNHSGGKGGKVHYFVKVLFPGVGNLQNKYTVLRRHPWLLPGVWLIRPFRKLLFERKDIKKQQERMKELDRDSVAQQKQMLNYVGLDYHF